MEETAVRFSLPYHDGSLELDMAARRGIKVIGDSCPVPIDNLHEELKKALEAPVGARPFREILPRSGTITVLISDLTRGGSTGAILGHLLAFLEEGGAGPERVSILLALGMHGGLSEAERRAHLGNAIVEGWKVLEHAARDSGSLVEVGITPAGTQCSFNRQAVESSLVIALGSVSFHYFAGFGGGRKLIVPGIAGERTILANHRRSLKRDPGEGLVDQCRPGALDGNPVHEDMLAGARLLATRVFAVNMIPDHRGGIVFLNAGELDASHRAACDACSAMYRIPVDRLYGAVIVSAGGYPKDMNLLQSHKAIRHASYALDEGGLLLAAAACSGGIGSDSYLAAFDDGRHAVPDAVRKGYTLNAQTALSTYELTGSYSIYLRSMMPDGLVCRFGFCPWKEGFEDFLLEGIDGDDILINMNASQFLPWPA